jgi:hypothetical protein
MSPKCPPASFPALAAALLVCAFLAFAPASVAQSGTAVIIVPATASVQVPGGMQQFDARLTTPGPNRNVRWSLGGAGCGGSTCGKLSETSSASGSAITYTAPAKLPSPAKVTLTATSAANSSKRAHVTITLTGPVSAAITAIKFTVPTVTNGKVHGGGSTVPTLLITPR